MLQEGPRDLSDTSDAATARPFADLFGDHDTLVVQHMMMAPEWEKGCPMCSLWVDGFQGVAAHLDQSVSFAVVARAPLARLRAWARERGWTDLRLLSSEGSSFNEDLGVELAADRQLPGLSVFTREADGGIAHFYTSEGSLVERHHRMMDLLNPVWEVLDLLPEGRGDWMPSHSYDG